MSTVDGTSVPAQTVVLRLYVVGNAPLSTRAVVNTRRLCEEHLAGRHRLEVIDLRQHPQAAVEADLIAAPTLVKALPLPVRRFIGDMSRGTQVLLSLDIV